MVLAQKQKYRSMEQDREPKLPVGSLLWRKEARIFNGTKTASSKMMLGKLDSYVQKNEIRSLLNVTHKDKLKMA